MSREILGISIGNLIISAGVMATAAAGVILTSASNVANETLFLNQLVSSARDYASIDADATNITAANLISAKKVPQQRISGTTITSKWGGTLTLASANIGGSAGDGFTISYPTVPTSECETFAKDMAPTVNTMTIAGTSVKAYGGNLTTSGATGVTTLCAGANTVAMVFGFTVK